MLSCSIWFSAPSFWMGGGLESSCVGHVYGADGAVRRHVEFYSKNKFEKLVHQVGFIIRIYHDSRSPERQIINLLDF